MGVRSHVSKLYRINLVLSENRLGYPREPSLVGNSLAQSKILFVTTVTFEGNSGKDCDPRSQSKIAAVWPLSQLEETVEKTAIQDLSQRLPLCDHCHNWRKRWKGLRSKSSKSSITNSQGRGLWASSNWSFRKTVIQNYSWRSNCVTLNTNIWTKDYGQGLIFGPQSQFKRKGTLEE